MYLNIPYKINYDVKKYYFKEIIYSILEIEDIDNIHKLKHYDILTRNMDQSTIWHKKYYENFEKLLKPLYVQLVMDLKNQFQYEKIIYQKIPSFRVQLGNGNVAVGEWHKDKTYNHGQYEVNFWLPFVDTNEKNSVWIESKEDLKDYKPYTVKYGEILVFNGSNLNHGNVKNDSGKSRLSIDFRMVDPSLFVPNNNVSINTNTKFNIGGYFDII